jgi:2-polyprenyl-6-methoxyphenol hydroxylase-like FAD-dependent oxidoreductase
VARQWFANGEILALLPLDGEHGHTCALVWSASPDRAQALQAMDATEFCEALQSASNQVLGALELRSERKVWPLQAAQAKHWCGSTAAGSWVLAGDAAHNVHPLAGQGLNLGLGDVTELVQLFSQRAYWRSVGDRRLLRSYERARKADYAVVGGSGDALQQVFQSPVATIQKLRHIGMLGFERSGRLKQWVASQAMGSPPKRPGSTPSPV